MILQPQGNPAFKTPLLYNPITKEDCSSKQACMQLQTEFSDWVCLGEDELFAYALFIILLSGIYKKDLLSSALFITLLSGTYKKIY